MCFLRWGTIHKCITLFFLVIFLFGIFQYYFSPLLKHLKWASFLPIINLYHPPRSCPQTKHYCFVTLSILLVFWLTLVFILNVIFLTFHGRFRDLGLQIAGYFFSGITKLVLLCKFPHLCDYLFHTQNRILRILPSKNLDENQLK